MSRHKYLIVIGTVLFVDVLFLFPYSGIQLVAFLHLNNMLTTSPKSTMIRWGLQVSQSSGVIWTLNSFSHFFWDTNNIASFRFSSAFTPCVSRFVTSEWMNFADSRFATSRSTDPNPLVSCINLLVQKSFPLFAFLVFFLQSFNFRVLQIFYQNWSFPNDTILSLPPSPSVSSLSNYFPRNFLPTFGTHKNQGFSILGQTKDQLGTNEEELALKENQSRELVCEPLIKGDHGIGESDDDHSCLNGTCSGTVTTKLDSQFLGTNWTRIGSSKFRRYGPSDEDAESKQKLSTLSGLRSSTCCDAESFFEKDDGGHGKFGINGDF